MARGWESKSVEAQQEQAASSNVPGKPRLTRDEANRVREKQSIVLSLKRIVEQLARSRNAHHLHMLELAKLDLEEKLERLNF